jgi:23S rRNA (guanosine2251-2'-O)-methyltransferase
VAEIEYLFGIHAVQSALENDARHVDQIWIDQKRHDRRIKELTIKAEKNGVPVRRADAKTLERLSSGQRNQGVVAQYEAVSRYSETDLDHLIEKATPPLVLVLDGVTDPHNLGACLRTAEASGVTLVMAPKDRAVGLTPTVRKVASGAAERLPFIQVTNLARSLDKLKELGLWVIGTSDVADEGLFQARLEGPLALVMGAEGKGMRQLTQKHCDSLISIPMLGKVESLNVSVATGVCLYEIVRQRQTA